MPTRDCPGFKPLARIISSVTWWDDGVGTGKLLRFKPLARIISSVTDAGCKPSSARAGFKLLARIISSVT